MGKNERQWLLRSLIYEAKERSLLSAPQRPGGATSAALTAKPSLAQRAWLAFEDKQCLKNSDVMLDTLPKCLLENKNDKSKCLQDKV